MIIRLRRLDRHSLITAMLLVAIVLVAIVVRVYRLDAKSFWHDEFDSIELACGRGYARFELPTDRLIVDPPNLTSLSSAAPLWRVWFAETRGHVPPLHVFLLRLWGDVFGLSQASARGFSVVASVLAMLALFEAVRQLSGTIAALWAAAIMALAGPQIEFAQEARAYALLVLLGLIAAAVLVRIERRGFTPWRGAGLAVSVLAMALTHYFAIGAMSALFVYAVIRLRSRARVGTLYSFAAAGLVWCALGAPVALRQESHVNDAAATDFVKDTATPGHVGRTFARVAELPARYITEPMGNVALIAAMGCVAYALAIALPLARRDLLLWGLWLCLTIAPIAALDFIRGTKHLEFMRYTVLAGPALYALIAGAMSTSKSRWLVHLAPAATVLSCALALPAAYEAWWKADWRALAAQTERARRPGDVFAFADASDYKLFMPAAYRHLNYYARDPIRPIVLLTQPPGPKLLGQLHDAPGVLLVVNSPDAPDGLFPPDLQDAGARPHFERVAFEPGAASVWRVTWRSSTSLPTSR